MILIISTAPILLSCSLAHTQTVNRGGQKQAVCSWSLGQAEDRHKSGAKPLLCDV